MIDSTTASKQLERLSGLDFYPKEPLAKKELRLALECALQESIAAEVVSDWLASSSACPKPAELRRNINGKQQGIIEQRRGCSLCGGAGYITVWDLVTYRGKSWIVDRKERLDIVTQEEANKFMEKLKAGPQTVNQTVLSAACECRCRRAA